MLFAYGVCACVIRQVLLQASYTYSYGVVGFGNLNKSRHRFVIYDTAMMTLTCLQSAKQIRDRSVALSNILTVRCHVTGNLPTITTLSGHSDTERSTTLISR